MSRKWAMIFLIVLVIALLAANLRLIHFYFRTRQRVEKKMGLKYDPSYEYASLDPAFSIAAKKDNRNNEFWCITDHNAVTVSVRNGRIRTIGGLASQDVFFWGTSKEVFNLEVGKRDLLDFNQDFIFDYMYWYPDKFIRVGSEWLPVKEMPPAIPRTARLKDGRRFVWQKNAWVEKR